jgi:hypothetical protein
MSYFALIIEEDGLENTNHIESYDYILYHIFILDQFCFLLQSEGII